MFDDIIRYIKNRTSDGYRRCKYNKKWNKFGTMMSPINIHSTSHHRKNNVRLTSVELDKLFTAVTKRLTDEKLIMHRWDYEYLTPNSINYTLSIQFDIEVPPIETIEEATVNSPSNSPKKNEYDFKCGSC